MENVSIDFVRILYFLSVQKSVSIPCRKFIENFSFLCIFRTKNINFDTRIHKIGISGNIQRSLFLGQQGIESNVYIRKLQMKDKYLFAFHPSIYSIILKFRKATNMDGKLSLFNFMKLAMSPGG